MLDGEVITSCASALKSTKQKRARKNQNFFHKENYFYVKTDTKIAKRLQTIINEFAVFLF
jgi:hypothetical protein